MVFIHRKKLVWNIRRIFHWKDKEVILKPYRWNLKLIFIKYEKEKY